MNRETMATDVRYALGQLVKAQLRGHADEIMADAVQRAIDALERVEAGLAASDGRREVEECDCPQCEPGSERGLPCDTGLQDQIGERQYDYGCYGT